MTLTAAQLKTNGFRISSQVSDEQVAKAQDEAETCYIGKVIETVDDTDTDVAAAIMQLTFVILSRRNTIVTRAGSKDKLAPSLSENATLRQIDIDEADRLLRVLQAKTGGIEGNPSELVEDIAHIYYRTEYLGL